MSWWSWNAPTGTADRISKVIGPFALEQFYHHLIFYISLEAFEVAWNSRAPFQCCQLAVHPDLALDLLSEAFRAQYELWLEERAEPNPIYCSNRMCGIFLPLRHSNGPDEIRCNRCVEATCRHCRNRFHPGRECAADIGTQQVRGLAASQGWKACPSCAHMVERRDGCIHMTCRCGAHFCYGCGRPYNVCPSLCG